MAVATLFRALGDPIRLEMVSRLASGESFTITSLSTDLGVSRQGARKHLAVLHEAELVHLKTEGRDTYVSLDREALERGKAFIAELELRWDVRLEKLREFVENTQA